jgi:hypothetical protein
MSQLGISASSPVDARFDFQSERLACAEDFLDGNGLRGTRERDISRVRRNVRRIGGQLALQPNAAELALLLPWALGADASGTTYALADTLPERYVSVDRVAKVFLYSGCKVDRATFRAGQGEALQLALDLVGQDETVGNAGTFPSLSIDVATGPFIFTDLALTIGGTTYNAKEFELTIDNKLDKQRFFNSATLVSVVPTDREISLRTSLPYGDATTAYNSGPGGVAVVATFTNGTVSVAFSLVKVTFPRRSPHVPGRSEIMVPMEGTAYHSGSTNSLVVTLDSTP